jgi:hypothetical protein
MPLSLLGAPSLEQTLARGGSEVECHVAFRVDNASRRHGAAESQWRTWAEMRTQGGGAVWCHGGIDGRNVTPQNRHHAEYSDHATIYMMSL